MLSGHTDVVPVDGQPWTVPLALTQRDGRCYGRGSADMKGFLACVLAAIPDFLAQPLRMPLHGFSYDEEVGCLGVRSLVAHLQASAETGDVHHRRADGDAPGLWSQGEAGDALRCSRPRLPLRLRA